MKIVFVRHGEPDYKNNTITPKGWREAELLAKRIQSWKVTEFYCSPFGRALDTASCTLKLLNRSAQTLPWIREFSYPVEDPVTGPHSVPWDFNPSFWCNEPLMFSVDEWVNAPIMKTNPDIAVQYRNVCQNFDKLLASYGYIREKKYYTVLKDKEVFLSSTILEDGSSVADELYQNCSEPLIVIFCHLGVTCLVLSHLLNIPFETLTHGFYLPPSSITVLSSEEHWGNEAYFRVQTIGDVSHLLMGGEPVSSVGSFAKAFQK